MKCPKCRTAMQRRQNKVNDYYYECPKCHTTIGKKEDNDTNNSTNDNTSQGQTDSDGHD